MHPDVEAATQHVIGVRARVRAGRGIVSVQEIEDELCVGYAQALAADAWLTEADVRLHQLLAGAGEATRASELRALSVEFGEFQRSVIALRRELARLRSEHDRLRAASRAA